MMMLQQNGLKRDFFNKEFLLKSCKETGVMLTITPAPISICAKKESIFISCPLRILVLMARLLLAG